MKVQKWLPYILLTSSLSVLIATTARSEEVGIGVLKHPRSTPTDANSNQSFTVKPIREIRRISELVQTAKSAEILSQAGATEIVPVSGVKANATNQGVEVILQTSLGEQLEVVNRSSGNNFIADIPNAQLRLPNGDAFTFRSEQPIAGITEITVTNLDANTIRVTVIGEAGVPTVELFDSPDEGLILSVASAAPSTQPQQQPQTPQQQSEQQQPATPTQPEEPAASTEDADEPIELVVTGEQDGYRVEEASTATRTDTPLRDIPQSIQVVPQQVIRDQGIRRIVDATRNVSGVSILSGYGNLSGDTTIRGFSTSESIRDGFFKQSGFIYGANVEQVEVLKGPASVLYGQLEPGGVVNYITKKPLNNPYYSAEFTAGNYDFYSPAIDLSGPLTPDKNLLYRLNVSYENSGSYRDFIDNDILFVSPAFTYKISDATNLDFSYEYLDYQLGFDRGFLPKSISFDLPINRNLGEPDDFQNSQSHRLNLALNHQFSDNLELRSGFSTQFTEGSEKVTNIADGLADDGRTLNRSLYGSSSNSTLIDFQTDLISKFNTGSIGHQLLFGVAWNRNIKNSDGFYNKPDPYPSINIFEPTYGFSRPTVTNNQSEETTDTVGIYLQDQVTLLPNLKLLIGGRYDFISSNSEYIDDISKTSEPAKSGYDDGAFSPRVGIVYQPIEPISLYASYTRSFTLDIYNPAPGGELLEPSRGTQFEVGVKAELFDKRLSATLAAYDIAKTNIATPIDGTQFYTALGEVKSRGIELDVVGEILPGWKVIASGYLNDTYVSEDNDSTREGKRLENVPYHGASLWTTYEIQSGDLRGLQFGGGFFFVGDRIANQDDPFLVPSYIRTDASISYKRDNWRVGLNFKNIFDVKYYETNGYFIFPQAPFTVQGTISVQF